MRICDIIPGPLLTGGIDLRFCLCAGSCLCKVKFRRQTSECQREAPGSRSPGLAGPVEEFALWFATNAWLYGASREAEWKHIGNHILIACFVEDLHLTWISIGTQARMTWRTCCAGVWASPNLPVPQRASVPAQRQHKVWVAASPALCQLAGQSRPASQPTAFWASARRSKPDGQPARASQPDQGQPPSASQS